MKKYQFDFQEILELRKFQQEKAESELSKAMAEVNKWNQKLEAIAVKQKETDDFLHTSLDFSEYTQCRNYYIFLDRKKEESLQELAKANLIADEKRKILKAAMQKVDVLEKLKEDEFLEWKKQAAAQEELSIEDSLVNKFIK